MLVLSRKSNEKVVIGGNITITVVEVKGGRVRIGIQAPADVVILRGELVLEGRCLAACLAAESSERDIKSGQAGADPGGSGLRPDPILEAAIKTPLRRLRRIPR